MKVDETMRYLKFVCNLVFLFLISYTVEAQVLDFHVVSFQLDAFD